MFRRTRRDRFQVRRVGRAMGVAQLNRRNPELLGIEPHAIDPPGVVEHGFEPALGHVGADPLDHLPRCERLAERRDRARPPLGTDHIPIGTQLAPERGDRPLGVLTRTIDPPNPQRHGLTSTILKTRMTTPRSIVYQYRQPLIGRNG